MDLAEKRREARRLKILQNSEDRLKKITGLERKSSLKTPPPVEPATVKESKNSLETESPNQIPFLPHFTTNPPNKTVARKESSSEEEAATFEFNNINAPIGDIPNSNSRALDDNIRELMSMEGTDFSGYAGLFSLVSSFKSTTRVGRYKVFFLFALAAFVNLFLSVNSLQKWHFNEIFGAVVTFEVLTFFASPTWLQNPLECSVRIRDRIKHIQTRPLIALFQFVTSLINDTLIYFFAFVCCDFVKLLLR